MLYEFDLTIPANTTEASPTELEAVMSVGTIHQVEVQIPLGCKGLTHVQVLRELHQLWPSNPESNVKGDNALIRWREDYDLNETPFSLTLRGWNVDDSYAHTITFRFALLGPDAKQAASETAGLLRRIGDAIFGGA